MVLFERTSKEVMCGMSKNKSYLILLVVLVSIVLSASVAVPMQETAAATIFLAPASVNSTVNATLNSTTNVTNYINHVLTVVLEIVSSAVIVIGVIIGLVRVVPVMLGSPDQKQSALEGMKYWLIGMIIAILLGTGILTSLLGGILHV